MDYFYIDAYLQQSMFSNNQCKTKLNKRIGANSNTKDSKVRESPVTAYLKTNRKQPLNGNNSVSRLCKPSVKQIDRRSKSKEKELQSKNVQQQYYIKQKCNDRPKKGTEGDRKKCTGSSKCIIEGGQTKNILHFEDSSSKIDKFQIPNRVNIPQLSNVITFEGKVIKLPPKGTRTPANNNYTSLSSYQDSVIHDQFTNDKLYNKKTKLMSKQKKTNSKVNIGKDFPIKSKGKHSKKHCKSQEYLTYQSPRSNKFQWQLTMKNQLGQQTQISPFRQAQYQRTQKFDYQQIYDLINQDLKACSLHEIKVNIQVLRQRKQCIQFLSQICGELLLRRETFYLALSIFDRACNKRVTVDNFKLLALVSLTLSLKLQQASLSQQFVYVLGVVNSDRESYLDSISSCKSSSKPKSISQRKNYKKSSTSNSLKKWKPAKITIKEQDFGKISIGTVAKLMKKYNCNKISKKQFMDMQEKVTIYLRFRLWRIQAIFWADLLTCMWDQHVLSVQSSPNYSILFRSPNNLRNITHLYQIIEMSYLNQNVYNYPSIYIVLSTMYLLVRIEKQKNIHRKSETNIKERQKDGYANQIYQFYKQSLSSSTNVLFVDRTGINQMYWFFLEKLRMQMVDILACCQFVSQFLVPQVSKTQPNNELYRESVDAGLCIHVFNSSIY